MVLGKLRAILRHKKYQLFTRPYELNIVGMRGNSTVPNRFDDEIHIFYKVSPLKWNYHVYKATTDPGTFWLRNPMQEQGTAVLAQGQYVNAYALGLHRGQYGALVQQKPLTIIRDYDRDAKLDFSNGTKTTGYYGINIHRANRTGTTKTVDKYSAGCQVFENAEAFQEFIKLCEHHSHLYGNHFTYTLIDFRAVKREALRRTAYSIGTLGLIVLSYLTFRKTEKLRSITEEIKDTFSNLFKTKPSNDNNNS
jgi:hypothetical protein